MNIRRIASDALLSAIALTIFIVEAQIPLTFAVPGIKLGLSNIVTLITMYLLSKKDAGAVLLTRIVLGSVFSGNTVALLYSVAGGALAYSVMCLSSSALSEKQIWAVSIFSAIAHNMGQLMVAALVMRSSAVFAYTPVLVAAAIFVGAFTGISAQYTFLRLKNLRLK